MKIQHSGFSQLELAWHSLVDALSHLPLVGSRAEDVEPKVQCTITQDGQSLCYAYEPKTGQMTYLESEKDFDRWLEERFDCQR